MFGRRFVIAGLLLAAATAAVGLVMLLVTVPHLAGLAGAPIFDVRLCGYSLDQAQALLEGLG